jgi:plastocyanin
MQGARFRTASAAAIMTIALVGVLVVAGCSSSSDSEPSGGSDTGGGVAPDTATLSIADLTFEPATLPIAAGSTDITIANADSTNHTFTLDDGSVSEPVDAGQTVTVTVEGESGASLPYHCEIHSSMSGTLQVA